MKRLKQFWNSLLSKIKSRATEAASEFKDVKKALKNVASQSKDVIDAAKGKKRRGRPKNK